MAKNKNNQKKKKVNINHNPQVESVKACYGEPKADKSNEFVPRTFH